jgi:WD40 repeat protein
MTEERRARLWALFDQAADLLPPEQRALLDAACPDDSDFRAEVERLLADDARVRSDEGGTDFLKSPLVRSLPTPTTPSAPDPPPPVRPRLDRYRVVRVLGEGGMGTVYEAEQDNPRRTVALKVIRAGLASDFLLKRFAREGQILGRLHHPGIAQVYDAGVADNGQPYFAIELVAGAPLDQYARDRALDVPGRLELVARVCDAVQHAHERGVIHRDLKPGNILVEPSGQPKVLDFGVARAVDAGLTAGGGSHTEAGQLIGTLRYMSPEQASGDPSAIDQRSDVYALGVILYELLASRLPYRLDGLPLAEAVHVIREHEPSRLGSFDGRLRGDVETVVAKALAKDKARRYASAGELAADVRRHLNSEPIRARPTSALYQLRKFARRNKALVAGAAGVFAALLAGTVVSLAFAWHAAQSARVASAKEREATYEAYRARLAAAAASLFGHDVADAARHLDAAPEALRGWEWRHLHSRLDDSVAVIPAPSSSRLSPGQHGLRLVTLADQRLRVVDEQGHVERDVPFPHEKGPVWAVAQGPDGLLILDSVGGTTARLRDSTGVVRLTVRVPDGATIYNGWLSPAMNRLAIVWTTPAGYSAGVYDLSGNEHARLSNFHRADVWSVVFSPDGTRLASASDDNIARLWDATGGPIGGPLRHPGNVARHLSAAFRPDGERVVTAAGNGTVCQWDARTGAAVATPYERHEGEVWAAVYSPDGQWVASAGADRTVRLWRATGRDDSLVLHGHTGRVTQLAFAADGRRLGSVGEDGTARIWEVDLRTSLPALRGHIHSVYPVAFSPDGRWIASGGWDSKVILWDAATGEPCASLPHPDVVRALAFVPGRHWLVTGGDGLDRLQVWDVAIARVAKEIQCPGSVRSLAVSPDGRRVAVTVQTTKIHLRVYDLASGERLFFAESPSENASPAQPLAYSPDGRWLAVPAADEKAVVLLDARTYEAAATFSGHRTFVISAAFSPDSRRLATCSVDHSVRLWQVDGGDGRVLSGHTDEVFAVAFHPDGTRLATAGRDRAVWLWDLERGEEVARLPGHTSFVWSLAFSPDGATLASGSGDTTVRLWDTAPLNERYRSRREVEAARPEAERLVESLWREKNDPAGVVEALRADRALGEPLSHSALRAALRRAVSSEAAPRHPHDRP